MSNKVMISEGTLIGKLLDWIVGLLIAVFGWAWLHLNRSQKVVDEKLNSADKRIALLEQNWIAMDTRRREDRAEIMKRIDDIGARIDRHHEIIYKKLDLLTERLPSA